MGDMEENLQNIIEAKDLVKKFAEVAAVDGVSFSVKKGEILAFLGPNGAGKTTTIRMLTTLLRPDSGKIIVNGFDVTKQMHDARKSFGIVFQDPSVDNELTAFENLEFHGILYNVPPEIRRERIEYLLGFVGLKERRNSFVKTFSGGMKRRLEIARGLIHHPKILFLDEPTLGLDPQTRNSLWNYIRKLNKEEHMSVFLTTHHMEEADKIAHTIAVIDNGKIIAKGTSRQLQEQTKTKSLESAFLELTGKEIREQVGTVRDRARFQKRMWRR
jgi:ABC-2 type transport system ATP-binding protein